MAIKTWKAFDAKFGNDKDVLNALYNSGIDFNGMNNDDERIDAALAYLKTNFKDWNNARYDELRREYGNRRIGSGPFVYTPKSIASALGTYNDSKDKEGNDIKGLDKFRDDYWSADGEKRAIWKDKFEQEHGKGSWELVKKVMQADLHDKMMRDIAKKRADIIEGTDKDSPVSEYILSSLMGLFTPRVKQAYKEGRTPSWSKEVLGDLAENAFYAAVPVGRIGGLAAKGVAKALPKAMQATTRKGAGKILGGAAAEFVAPTAVETTDYLLGNSDFEPEDIIIGGATNLGVNKGLGRSAGLLLGTLGKKVSTKVPKPIKERLEGVKTPKEKAETLIDEAKETMRLANLPESEAYKYVAQTGENLPSKEAQQKAIDVLRVAEAADPKLRKEASDNLTKFINGSELEKQEAIRAIQDYDNFIQKQNEKIVGAGVEYEAGLLPKEQYENIVETAERRKAAKETAKNKATERVLNMTEEITMSKERLGQLQKAEKAQEIIDALPSELSVDQEITNTFTKTPGFLHLTAPNGNPVSRLEKEFGLSENTFLNNPEFLSLFGKEIKPTWKETLGEDLFAWGVNKAGTDSDASVLNTISQGTLDPKKLREGQYKRREQKKQNKAAAVLQKTVEDQGFELTEEDKQWLGKIQQNPGMVSGYGAGSSPEFHRWMLVRGTDLLRGTDLARPAFKVE